ncbi:glutathione S-transferase [Ceratobasidium sp. AG-I]|nr:glutathione S-transferase [Ceratobasidium sp. AG-I]
MVIKIYGADMSTCTKRVAITCNELGLKYEVVPVNILSGENRGPQYVKNMQPFAMVPVLVDEDGTQIYESRAIARYLVAKYGKDSTLMATASDAKAYGLFEQAASIEYSSFDPSASELVKQRVFSKLANRESNEVIAKKCQDTLHARMEGYERVLSRQKYLAGEHVTLADLFHIPYGVHINQVDPTIFGSKPNVKRWWDDITSRESWKALN